jgi:hypothetical protein
MTNEVVKPSKLIRGMTSGMRAHLDAVERAREIYLTGMKNLESDYFTRIKRAMENLVPGPSPLEPEAPPADEAAPVTVN